MCTNSTMAQKNASFLYDPDVIFSWLAILQCFNYSDVCNQKVICVKLNHLHPFEVCENNNSIDDIINTILTMQNECQNKNQYLYQHTEQIISGLDKD